MNNLKILYEDNHIIVVIKPYNVPVQADSSNDLDMLTIIKNYIKKKYNKPGNVYLGLVHRLDRPVGGVMVFAKTSKAAARLSEEVRTNKIHKTYLTVVHGVLDKKCDKLINKMSKDEKTHNSYIDEKNGKEAILEYKVIKEEDNLSLLKINLITGKHHQIRLQLSNINHPIYGDQRYGFQDKKQIMLYAYKLEFTHPVTKELMTFKNLPNWNIVKSEEDIL